MMFSKKAPKVPTIKQDKFNQIGNLYERIAKDKEQTNTEWELQRIRAYQKAKCICYVTGEYVKFNEFKVHRIHIEGNTKTKERSIPAESTRTALSSPPI